MIKLEMKPRYRLDLEIKIGNKKIECNNLRSKLLQCIDKYGSIVKASEETGIPYRTALKNIEIMERELGSRIVITKRGGKGGGGTSELTNMGKQILLKFIKINRILKTRVDINEIEGTVSNVDEENGIIKVVLDKEELSFPITHNLNIGDEIFILLRPVDVVVMHETSESPVTNILEGILTKTQVKNDIICLNIDVNGNNIIATMPKSSRKELDLNCGNKLFIGFKEDSVDIYKKGRHL
ncbi:winged helix-turn-helix domain-containing protein [Methanobacterium sp.]|uniref:winged helix-turn-helix domain-containing protein n=1 Tax=Methanobacterium sp. TaxID=2164 RepID=UPI003C75C744